MWIGSPAFAKAFLASSSYVLAHACLSFFNRAVYSKDEMDPFMRENLLHALCSSEIKSQEILPNSQCSGYVFVPKERSKEEFMIALQNTLTQKQELYHFGCLA